MQHSSSHVTGEDKVCRQRNCEKSGSDKEQMKGYEPRERKSTENKRKEETVDDRKART